MYCGNNKTALASQLRISEAMMALIREKPYQQITVSELCRTAGISRQTFYSLFTSREKVVVFSLQSAYCTLPDVAPAAEHGLRQMCRAYSAYMLENQALIRLLVNNDIDHLLYDSFFDSMNHCECFLRGKDPCLRRYAASFYAGGLSRVAREYAREDCAASAEQLEGLLMALFSGEMFKG